MIKHKKMQKWGEIERKHPGMFGGTPHLWVCKISI